jgi:hypothetical protein
MISQIQIFIRMNENWNLKFVFFSSSFFGQLKKTEMISQFQICVRSNENWNLEFGEKWNSKTENFCVSSRYSLQFQICLRSNENWNLDFEIWPILFAQYNIILRIMLAENWRESGKPEPSFQTFP